MEYTKINSNTINSWIENGWEWGKHIDHQTFLKAKQNDWSVVLTPNIIVPKNWFGNFKNEKILGLAAGGGQQMPIFAALGADCTVLDYSEEQLKNEEIVAKREGYSINIIHADMTKRLPFENEVFDLIFHPVSNCYIHDVNHIWNESYRVLKYGGVLLSGFSNSINFLFDENSPELKYKLPFNPLNNSDLFNDLVKTNSGIQFSHTIEEQIGGQLKAGFELKDIYQDTDSSGCLKDFNVPIFYATRSIKKNPTTAST